MQKTVLLINKGKSFMVVTIAKSFTDAGYKVVEVEPTMGNYEEAYRRSQAGVIMITKPLWLQRPEFW